MSETLVAPAEPIVVEEPQLAKPAKTRLLSLDVFRGITMASMIMVNNPGDWGRIYSPLGHAKWNGWTPTDLVFPSFLFIVGVAMTFSFDRRLGEALNRVRLFEHVLRRTIILICLGLIIAAFPIWRLMAPYLLTVGALGFMFWDEPPISWPEGSSAKVRKVIGYALLAAAVIWFVVDFSQFFQQLHPPAVKGSPLRLPGVLQRIAICYLLASVVMMFLGVRGRVFVTVALILGYWWILTHAWGVAVPEKYPVADRPEGVLHAWIDAKLLGQHIYGELPEPEGILSTLGGLATCMLGVLTGSWLRAKRSDTDKLIGMFVAANLLLVAGLWMNHSIGINKKIWTPSYVLFVGGIAIHALAMCYWLVDVKGYKRWCWPFVVFGTNAILVYFVSGIFGRTLAFYSYTGDFPWLKLGGAPSMRAYIWEHWFKSHFSTTGYGPYNASLAFALAYVLFWLIFLIPFYWKRIFVKV